MARVVTAKAAGQYVERTDLKTLVDQTDVAEIVMSYEPDDVKTASSTEGDKIRCKCPFPEHEDRHPSFHIWTSGDYKGRYSCSCSKGSLFNFIEKMEGIDFPAAIEFLKQRLPGGIIDRSFDAAKFVQRVVKSLLIEGTAVENVKMPPMPHCERNHKMIAHYLGWKRKYDLQSALKVIEDWGLLWCADQNSYFHTESNPRGICFANSIIIPMRSAEDIVVMWQAQFADARTGKNKLFPPDGWNPVVLPGMSRCIREGYRWAIMTEGFWDIAKAWHRGTPAIASTTAWMNEHQRKAVFEHLDLLVTAFDNDDAGREAAKRVEKSLGSIIKVQHLNIPHKTKLGRKLDIDEMSDDEFRFYLEQRVDSTTSLS